MVSGFVNQVEEAIGIKLSEPASSEQYLSSLIATGAGFGKKEQSYSTSTNRRHRGKSTTPRNRNQQHKNFINNYPARKRMRFSNKALIPYLFLMECRPPQMYYYLYCFL